MALSHSPSIVTDGLIACLDAANLKSYQGSGFTWNDISTSAKTASLLNGTTFSSANLGTFVFDSADDYCVLQELGSQSVFTVDCWFKPSSYTNNYACVVSSVYPGSNATVNFKIGYEGSSAMTGGIFSIGGQGWVNTPSAIPPLNVWNNYTFTYNGAVMILYTNGVSVGSTSIVGTPLSGGDGIRIGRRWDLPDYFAGNIANVKIYRRALNSVEVLQNFNALRGRFGI